MNNLGESAIYEMEGMMAKVKAPTGVFVMRGSDLDRVVLIPEEPQELQEEVNRAQKSTSRHHFYKGPSTDEVFRGLGRGLG